MKVDIIANGKALTIKIEGRIDTATAPELEQVINTGLDDVNDLTFDFSEVDYISSAGLRVLLIAIKKMNAQGTMKVSGAGELVKEVFEVTGFADMLTLV